MQFAARKFAERTLPGLTLAVLSFSIPLSAQEFDPFATDQLPESQGRSAKSDPAPVGKPLKPTVNPETAPVSEQKTLLVTTPTPEPSALPTPSVKPSPLPAPSVKPSPLPTPTVKPSPLPVPSVKPSSTKTKAEKTSSTGRVQTPAPVKKPRERKPEKNLESVPEQELAMSLDPLESGRVELTAGLENLNSVAYLKPVLNFAAYSNDVIVTPYLDLRSQLRPNIKLTAGRQFTLNLRPFAELRHMQSSLSSGKRKGMTQFTHDIGESVVTITPSGRVSLLFGQENFQWGTGEMASPSNWINRSTELAESLVRTTLTRVKTKQTVRLNLSAGQAFNLVAIAEYEPEKRQLPALYEGRRFLLKPEVSWNSGADFFGIVAGGAERLRHPFLGEYFSIGIADSMGLYLDAAHFKGSDLLHPVQIAMGDLPLKLQIFSQNNLNSDNIYHEVLAGLRYSFANGSELRFEAHSNSAGYTQSEMVDAEQMRERGSPYFPLFYSAGGETRSQKTLLISARRNFFGSKKNWSLLARYWKPVIDSSGGAILYTEYAATDNAVLFLAAGGFHGPVVSNAALTQRFVLTLGQKYVW